MEKDLLKKIKDLQEIQADQSWKESRRDLLMTQIQAQVGNAGQKGIWASLVSRQLGVFTQLRTYKMIFKHTGVMAMIVALALGSGVYGVYAAEKSLPGDILYNVKRTKERVRVSLTPSEEKKAKLHIEFASKRIQEIDVLKAQPIDSEKKVNKITVAVTEFKEDVREAKEVLSKAERKSKEPHTIIEVADLIGDKAEQFTEYLDKNVDKDVEVKKAKKQQPQLALTVKEAIKASKDVSNEAVNVLVKQKDKEGVADDVKEKIKTKVIQKIEKAQVEIDEVAEEVLYDITPTDQKEVAQVELVEQDTTEATSEQESEKEKQVEVSKENNQENSEEVNVKQLPENSEEQETQGDAQEEPKKSLTAQTVEEVKKVIEEEPKKADVLLDEATRLAQEGNLSEALEKVQATQSLVEEIKDKVEDIVKSDEVENEQVVQENTSLEEDAEDIADSNSENNLPKEENSVEGASDETQSQEEEGSQEQEPQQLEEKQVQSQIKEPLVTEAQ